MDTRWSGTDFHRFWADLGPEYISFLISDLKCHFFRACFQVDRFLWVLGAVGAVFSGFLCLDKLKNKWAFGVEPDLHKWIWRGRSTGHLVGP